LRLRLRLRLFLRLPFLFRLVDITILFNAVLLFLLNKVFEKEMAEPERRSVYVKRMIMEIDEALETQTPAQVSGQFGDFQKEFPKIFETLLTRKYNHEFMAMMLDQLDKKERGKTTQHDASVAVGTLLVDRIVKPQLAAAGKKV